MRDKRKDQPQSKDPSKFGSVTGAARHFYDELGIPPPPRSSGIIDLGENCEVIYGAQQLAGKIFIPKELAPGAGFPRIPLPPWLVSACWIVRRKDWDHSGV